MICGLDLRLAAGALFGGVGWFWLDFVGVGVTALALWFVGL